MRRLLALAGRSRGRLAGAFALLLALAAFEGGLFTGPRLALFDLYAQLLPRQRQSAPVVIVAIDDASLTRLGQWPWPRQRLAALVERILAARPAVVGLDLLLPEADRSSPTIWAREQEGLPPSLADALSSLPDNDALLAEAIAGGPVVVGVAGLRDGAPDRPGPRPMVASRGGDPLPWLPRFDGLLRSLPALDAAAAGHGLLSADKSPDGLVRRLPLLSAVADQYVVPAFAVEILRLAAGADRIDVSVESGGLHGIGLGPLGLASEPDGFVWLHLTPHDPRRFVSAADVLAGSVPADIFEQRLVLIGVTGLGLVDLPTTALGPMPGVELHAQLLENVFDGVLAERPRWAPWAEPATAAAVGALLILVLPWLRLRWYPLAALLPLAAFAALGFGAWWQAAWLIDAAGPAIVDGAVFIALLGGGLAEADAQRRRLRRDLEAQRLREARVAGELEAARRIQMGILPKPEALPPDPRYDLSAAIAPAREVGGDFYDFFLVGADHLFFMIGDVSGKGVPASLFMALGKALYKSCVLRGERDIGAIMAAANAEIARDNVEMLFITAFAGMLDLSDGTLAFCNAGHDAPWLVRPGAAPRQVDSAGGPPLCVMEDFPYAAEHLRLLPGDLLVLTTDGVTEAMNAAGALMGPARTAEALAALPPDAGARQAIDALRDAVAAFVGEAEPSDDLTLVAVRWRGQHSP
jgi:serine phosphatase RsbU (regulator of sigma subunit)